MADQRLIEIEKEKAAARLRLAAQAQASAQQQAASLPPAGPGAVSAFDETAIEPIPSREQLGQNFQRSVQGLDQLVRGVASGMTFGFADEIAAGLQSAFGGGTYEENLAAERAKDAAMAPATRAISEGIGALTTGAGLGRLGFSLLQGARPTAMSMGTRGAAEGALYGAAHGAGRGEGQADRVSQALMGAGAGALTGGALSGALGQVAQRATTRPPSVKDLRAQSDAIYSRVLDTGKRMDQSSYASMVDDLTQLANRRGIPENNPRVYNALRALEARKGQAPSLKEIDQLRIALRDAGDSAVKSERKLAGRLVRQFDKHMENVMPEIVPARRLWQRAEKGDTIEKIIASARKKANRFSGSGYENALRREFTRLADSPKRLRGFTEDEIAAIELVGEGGAIGNLMRDLGKYAPTGVVSGGVGVGGGAGLATLAGIDPLVGAAVLPAAGAAGRLGATLATTRNARNAAELMRAGGQPYRAPIDPAFQRQLLNSLRSGGIMGGLAPNLPDPSGQSR